MNDLKRSTFGRGACPRAPYGPTRAVTCILTNSTSGNGRLRISANVTADFGNVTDSAGLGVARCRL
ncbi:hypothetical protein FOB31_05010 [Burkholderia multivorans]|nr:hypothetical protein FOB31_05010 [Burkholderia multivorans]QET40219.1 hypothetical protein FOB30_21365 [Burkholderia multivorans]